jgi:hypothetical protein
MTRPKKYRNYSDEDIIEAVKTSSSLAQVLKKLDLIVAGGNYTNIKKLIAQLDLDTSHFTGKAWMPKGYHVKTFDGLVKPTSIKTRLLQEREHRCECCGLKEWLSQPITLELEHINGNRQDNDRDNLKLLCPNCHSQTPTWRRRKSSLEET